MQSEKLNPNVVAHGFKRQQLSPAENSLFAPLVKQRHDLGYGPFLKDNCSDSKRHVQAVLMFIQISNSVTVDRWTPSCILLLLDIDQIPAELRQYIL